jgi:hypothetical protein
MLKVTPQLKRIIKEKDLAIKTSTQSMLGMLRELQRQVLYEIGQAAIDSWDSYHLKKYLDSIEWQISNFNAKVKAEATGLLSETWKRGQELVDKPLAIEGIRTGWYLSSDALDVLKDFAFHRLDGLTDDAWLKIRSELNLGVMGGKTPQEVANAIGKNLTSPSIFSSIAARAEVIVKTEGGRIFSQATQLRMEQSAKNVPGLEKQWWHAGHPKLPRPSHLAADGQHVPVDQPFDIGGVKMMFPRAPGADLENVINCGCDSIPYHEEWK